MENKCDYCNGEQKEIPVSYGSALIGITDPATAMFVETEDEFIDIQITHCPMCGRKLEGESNH